ncbi:hypothetical protein [Microvirga soli]|uniref:hypothetical protein n=1 Tax=Microvirga soli TaxID=1854496 RepID=UPI00191F76BA|nr:hypothetical protein [Microvirga soli]
MPSWISRGSKAHQNVHLAHETFRFISQSEADLAVPNPGLEVVEPEQGFRIHIDVKPAVAFAVRANRDLKALEEVAERRRPFHNRVLG